MKSLHVFVLVAAATTACLTSGCSQQRAGGLAAERAADWQPIEARANTFTGNRQTDPAIDVDTNGHFVVVWGSRRQEHGTFGVFAQRFDPLGRRVGTEVHVNQTVPGMQMDPAVVCNRDGSVWIAWLSTGQDGDGAGIVMRRFGVDGDGMLTPWSDEMIVNQTTRGRQARPVLAAADGRVFVGWISDAAGRQIAHGRVYAADGAPLTDEFALGQGKAGHEWRLGLSGTSRGEIVAVWDRTTAENRPRHIYARLFASDGRALADEFVVNAAAGAIGIEPAVDVDGAGNFIVTWMQRQDNATRSYAVAYRRFDASGTPRGPVRLAATGPQRRSGAAVAVAPDGRFAISYNIDTPDQDAFEPNRPSHRWTPANVWAQRFDTAGAPTCAPYRVNTYDVGRQGMVIAASGRQGVWSAQNQLAFVWVGRTGHGDKRGVVMSLLAPRTLDVPAPTATPQVAAAQEFSEADVFPLIPPYFDPNLVTVAAEVSAEPLGPDYGFTGITSTGWVPPDPDIAVGPDHIVLVVNGQIKFMTHAGVSQFSQAIAGAGGFWGEVGATSFVFDPVAVFDPHSQRFIVAAAELRNGNVNSYLNIAVSDDDSPLGTWHKYRIDISGHGEFFDFPNLGVNRDAIFLAGDFFQGLSGNFVFVFPKAPMLIGDPVTYTPVRTSYSVRSTGTCKNFDDTATQYFMSAFYGSTSLRLHAITNPLTGATLHSFTLPVDYFSYPPDVDQLGTSNRASTIDVRTKNAVYRNGSLWVAHTIGEDGTARVRWYEIAMNGWPTSGTDPSLVQSGTLDLGPGEHTWFPDIHVDPHGNAALCFNRSSASQYISVERAIRYATDPAGTFQAPVLMQSSTSPEEGDRWGDYSGIDDEPDEAGTFWSHNEYRTSSWRTWVGKFETIPPDCNNNGVPDVEDLSSGTSMDCNENGVPDECDIADGDAFDCNGNGVPDACDIAAATSPDCDGNNTPDECDLASGLGKDCNDNGRLDECDLDDGASQDCNGNRIPDECDIASGADTDCNGNGVPDLCDLAAATSEDCNNNATPDECDLASGASDDCNVNGSPDECDLVRQPPTLRDDLAALQPWVDASLGGTNLNLTDNAVASLSLPFSNDLWTSGTVAVANDGGIGWSGSLNLASANAPLPSLNAFGGGPALLALWDDFDDEVGGVYHGTLGTPGARVTFVQWDNLTHQPHPDGLFLAEVTFQAHLHETPVNDIYAQVLYQDVYFNNVGYNDGASATVGYQHDTLTATQWSYNQAVITPELVLSLYWPPAASADANGNGVPDECEAQPQLGDVNCDGTVDTYDVDAFVLALGDRPAYANEYPNCDISLADCNQDGKVDTYDIDVFVSLITE